MKFKLEFWIKHRAPPDVLSGSFEEGELYLSMSDLAWLMGNKTRAGWREKMKKLTELVYSGLETYMIDDDALVSILKECGCAETEHLQNIWTYNFKYDGIEGDFHIFSCGYDHADRFGFPILKWIKQFYAPSLF